MADHSLRTLEAINEFQRRLNSKSTVFLTNSVMVQKSEFIDLLETIKRNLPEELEQCQSLMQEVASIKLRTETAAKEHIQEARRQANEILEEAQKKATEIIEKAQTLSANLLDKHQITERAKDYARSVETDAQNKARVMREQAHQISMNQLESLLADVDHVRSSIVQSMRKMEEKHSGRRP